MDIRNWHCPANHTSFAGQSYSMTIWCYSKRYLFSVSIKFFTFCDFLGSNYRQQEHRKTPAGDAQKSENDIREFSWVTFCLKTAKSFVDLLIPLWKKKYSMMGNHHPYIGSSVYTTFSILYDFIGPYGPEEDDIIPNSEVET